MTAAPGTFLLPDSQTIIPWAVFSTQADRGKTTLAHL